MGTLKINDFGAIKKAELEIKKINVFIGHTSTGKSTAAKLLAIFNSNELLGIPNGDISGFENLLKKYDIDFEIHENTEIYYKQNKYFWKISKGKFETNNDDADILKLNDKSTIIKQFLTQKQDKEEFSSLIATVGEALKKDDSDLQEIFLSLIIKTNIRSKHQFKSPIYIPAERLLISTFSNSMFSLLEAGATIPECISRFGALYEKARKKRKEILIDILNIKVKFDNENDTVSMADNAQISLKQASSGILSVLPLWTVLEYYLRAPARNLILIEEPELNLYPTIQLDLINWIMGKMKKSRSNIVITTHSPYILTAIDDLIMGNDIYTQNQTQPDIIKKLGTLLPTNSLINFNDVSSYFFTENGIIKNILDKETRSVGAEYLDEASERTSRIFNELSSLL